MMKDKLTVYHVYVWLAPYRGKYTVVPDYILPNGFIEEGAVLFSENDLGRIRHNFKSLGLTLVMRTTTDPHSLIESWI